MEKRAFTLDQLKEAVLNARPMIEILSGLNLDPGDCYLFPTENFHQGALYYLVTEYLPTHKEYNFEIKTKTVEMTKTTGIIKKKEKKYLQEVIIQLKITPSV